MKSFDKTSPATATIAVAFLGVAAFALSSQVASSTASAAPAATPVAAAAAAAVKPVTATVAAATQRVAATFPTARPTAESTFPALKPVPSPLTRPTASFASHDAVRSLLKFETIRWGGKPVQTLDEASRLLLARAAAEKAGLSEVGLSYRDVYGVIEAETSWIPRTGSSKDGTPNLGLAQFEPRTAKGMGVEDPQDPVQAVFGAAMYMKMGARWAAARIGHLDLDRDAYQAKVREGVSVYYNLSIKGRNKWNGLNAADLPIETQRHIRNVTSGVLEAAQLARQIKA